MAQQWQDSSGSDLIRKLGAAFFAVVIALVIIAAVIAMSIVKISGDQVGIVEKKLFGGSLPEGRIIAGNGENGIQAKVLPPGWHVRWSWQYDVEKKPLTEIEEGFVGMIKAEDGISLPEGVVYAPEWTDSDQMLKAEYFLGEGGGYKGPQLTVLRPGKYRLNTELFKITKVPVVTVRAGMVAVVKSNAGEVIDTGQRLVEVGRRGIWNKPLLEGQYYYNTNAYEIININTRQVKVSYTALNEPGEKSEMQPMEPINVRSSDGFTFPVDVRVSYRIDSKDAPNIVATVGDDELVLHKLVTPRVRSVFRDNAEKVKALDYVQNRSKQGDQSLKMLQQELVKYGITVLEVSIGDIGDEKSMGPLLKTQTDREIALQEQQTFEEQQRAAEKEKALKRTQQEAEEEKRLATAAYEVKIADENKKQVIIQAQAEAEQIKVVADAKAEAYQRISDVLGANNAALLEIMKLVGSEGVRITPDVMIGSGGGSSTDALIGTMLAGMLKDNQEKPSVVTKQNAGVDTIR